MDCLKKILKFVFCFADKPRFFYGKNYLLLRKKLLTGLATDSHRWTQIGKQKEKGKELLDGIKGRFAKKRKNIKGALCADD